MVFFFFSSRRRHTRFKCDWSSDVCSSDLRGGIELPRPFCFFPRLGEMSGGCEEEEIPVVRGRVAGPELDGALILTLSPAPVVIVVAHHPERGVGLRQ